MPVRQVRPLHLILVAILAVAVYSNTLGAPFVWDEEPLITNNILVHDFGYLLHPSRAKAHPYYQALVSRYVTYLSFAVNYAMGGTSVTGYHVFNIAVHALNSVLISLLMLVLMKAPLMQGSSLSLRASPLALLSGALFAAHPMMTEAVTYVFQRNASLVAAFYLLTLLLYSASRVRRSRALYIASIITAVLAMKTKENAFTLPLAVALCEFMFFQDRTGRRLLRLIPMLLTMSIIPVTLMSLGAAAASTAAPAAAAASETASNILGRAEYFYTQMPVIAWYMKMLILPLGQSIDHAYTTYASPLSLPVALSLMLHTLLVLLSGFLWYRASASGAGEEQGRDPALRLMAFGILWFYLALSVESTLQPLQMIITEYRAYLPGAGLIIVAVAVGALLAERAEALRPGAMRAARYAAVLILALMAVMAYARNSVWKTELGIWQDAADKNPSSTRPLLHVGLAYEKLEDYQSALKVYERAIELEPDHYMAHYDAGVIYNNYGQYDRAEAAFRKALAIRPDYGLARNNLAAVLMTTGRDSEAEAELALAIGANPWDPNPYTNFTVLLFRQGRYAEAEPYLLKLRELVPPSADLMNKLGIMYRESGRPAEARKVLSEGLGMFPDDIFLLVNLAAIEERSGSRAEALALYRRLFDSVDSRLAASPSDERLAHFRALAEQGIRTNSTR